MRIAKLGGQAVALAAVAALLALLVWRLTHQAHPPKIGGPAPNFSLRRLEGAGTLDLKSLRGHPVVLNFWASWCGPCKAESAQLQRTYLQYRSQGVIFLGVDYHDIASDARSFIDHHGITYPNVQDGSGKIGERYGITGVPETYFVDRRGRLVGSHVALTILSDMAGFRRGLRAALNS